MSDQLNAIQAALSRLQLGQDALAQRQEALHSYLVAEITNTRSDLQAEIVAARSQIMERLDRQQRCLEAMFNDIAVNWYSAERLERKVEGDREEIRLLVSMVSGLTRGMRTLESRLATLEGKL